MPDPVNPAEVWKAIPTFEGKYSVSNLGRVKGEARPYHRSETILKPAKKNNGYLHVNLNSNGEYISRTVHRLVLLSFNPPTNPKLEVNHLDGNKTNNALENLEWCTSSENKIHNRRVIRKLFPRPKIKRIPCYCKGESHYASRITEEDVRQIRRFRLEGWTQQSIANHFSIAQAHVSQILLGKKWKHVV